jgi:ABC-2 type transport system permease protein
VTASAVAVWQHRGILALLIRRDLSVKYQQSVLGYLWSLIEPLTIAATYWFIFGVLYGQRVTDNINYILFLASGLFAWIWVNGVLSEATTALTSQARLITTIKVPREIFAIGRVAGKFFEYLAALPVLVLIAVLSHARFGLQLLYLPLAVTVEAVLLIGVALLLAALNVMLRDTEKFVRLVQRVAFYALPIIYPLSKLTNSSLPVWVKVIYQVNPLVGIIELHHSAWTSQPPPALPLITAVVGSVVMLFGGWWVFRRLEPFVLKEL